MSDVFSVSLTPSIQVFLGLSRLEACHPGVVCLEGQLVGGHACQMSKPLDSLLLYIVVAWCCSDHFPDVLVSYYVSSGLVNGSS